MILTGIGSFSPTSRQISEKWGVSLVYVWIFRRFPEGNIDPRQLRILLFLKNNGPHTSGEIARTLGYSAKYTRRALQFLRRIGAVDVYLKPRRGLEDFE
ncbi:MAG: HTH domain-containing protein [Thaumarchaeota archaeon]|nr:HTH domain-containing protein [Nitrososphaerota archaeon]